ncbi:hypothetical protein I552_9897 [Mycobacterium xenopi 3993]|nr:hypothetical protein I552_9897 [Mycobacterium xenopi 3993]
MRAGGRGLSPPMSHRPGSASPTSTSCSVTTRSPISCR